MKGEMRRIAEQIAERHGVTVDDLVSASRKSNIYIARRELYYNLAARTNRSYPAIAAFCNRDHSTVIHGIARFMHRHGVPHPRTGTMAREKGKGKMECYEGVGLKAARFNRSWKTTAARDKKILVMFYYSRGLSIQDIAAAISKGRPGAEVTAQAVVGHLRKLREAGVEGLRRRMQGEEERAMSEDEMERHRKKIATKLELATLERVYPSGVRFIGNRASFNRVPALVPSFEHIWTRKSRAA